MFVDPASDESLIVEILEWKDDVADSGVLLGFCKTLLLKEFAASQLLVPRPLKSMKVCAFISKN